MKPPTQAMKLNPAIDSIQEINELNFFSSLIEWMINLRIRFNGLVGFIFPVSFNLVIVPVNSISEVCFPEWSENKLKTEIGIEESNPAIN